MSPCAHLFCALQTSITAAIVFQVCLPKIGDCHATIYSGKHCNVARNENTVCQLALRKHETVQIKVQSMHNKLCKHNANVLPPNMLMSSAKTHSLITGMCIAPKQLHIIDISNNFQTFCYAQNRFADDDTVS